MTEKEYSVEGTDFIYEKADIKKLLSAFPGKNITIEPERNFKSFLIEK